MTIVTLAARELRAQRHRAVVTTPHGGYLYVKHLPRRVKRAVKKGIAFQRLRPTEYRRVVRYLTREGQRDQSHHFRKSKAAWGPGPWQDEPDYVDFLHVGLQCVIQRNLHVTGSLNGYVGITSAHPWWGYDYGECVATPPCAGVEHDGTGPLGRFMSGHVRYDCDHRVEALVEVHGGITFAGPTIQTTKRIHHDLWWFGFDTGHAGDITPMMEATLKEVYRSTDPDGTKWAEHERLMGMLGNYNSYKDLAYVRHEVEKLAEQVAMAAQVYSHD